MTANDATFLELSDQLRELLVKLVEEATEICGPTCKALLHGMEATHAKVNFVTNRNQIEQEIGDLWNIVGLLDALGEISIDRIRKHAQMKAMKFHRYTHHQFSPEEAEIREAAYNFWEERAEHMRAALIDEMPTPQMYADDLRIRTQHYLDTHDPNDVDEVVVTQSMKADHEVIEWPCPQCGHPRMAVMGRVDLRPGPGKMVTLGCMSKDGCTGKVEMHILPDGKYTADVVRDDGCAGDPDPDFTPPIVRDSERVAGMTHEEYAERVRRHGEAASQPPKSGQPQINVRDLVAKMGDGKTLAEALHEYAPMTYPDPHARLPVAPEPVDDSVCSACAEGKFPRMKRYDGVWFHSFPEPMPDMLCGNQQD